MFGRVTRTTISTMQPIRGVLVPLLFCVAGSTGCSPPEQKCSEDRTGNIEACQEACEKGHTASCLAAAYTYDERFEKDSAGADAEKAVQFFEKGCLGGDVESCAAAVRGLLRGPSREHPELPAPHDVDDAPDRRRALLAKGCALDDFRLCYEAADAYLGVDREKAEQLGRKGCALELTDHVKRKACESERAAPRRVRRRGREGV